MLRHSLLLVCSLLLTGIAFGQTDSTLHSFSVSPHKEGVSLGYGFALKNNRCQIKTIHTVRFTTPDKLSNTYSTISPFEKDIVNLKEYNLRAQVRLGKFHLGKPITPFFAVGPHLSSITYTRIPSQNFGRHVFPDFGEPAFTTQKRYYGYRIGGELMGGVLFGELEGIYLGVSSGFRLQHVTGTIESLMSQNNVGLFWINPYQSGIRLAGQIELGYRFKSKRGLR